MKRKNCIIVLAVLTCLGLTSCSANDDGMDSNASSLQVYGLQYNLASGVIWKNNPNILISTEPYIYQDTYADEQGNLKTDKIEGFTVGNTRKETGNFMLSLYEAGLSFNPTLQSIAGKGACICFHLSSPDTDQLKLGKYVYGKEKAANTFLAYSSVLYDTQNSVDPAEIMSGELIIEKQETNYHIEFKGINTRGAEIMSQYDGQLRECKVRQSVSATYEDVSLAGLLDTITTFIKISGIEYPPTQTLDYDNGAAFFTTLTGASRLASDIGKEMVDIALLWDKKTESFIFESPIRMRSWLGHNDDYNFPCHTIYMKAPSSFTDEDFEKLEDRGFFFDIKEEKVVFGTTDFKPGYVFFQAGNGVQGVMHIKRYTPMGTKINDLMGMGFYFITTPINPTLIIDIKAPANFVNPKIR